MRKSKASIKETYNFLKKKKELFPLMANLERWWYFKTDKSTSGKRTMHLFLTDKLADTLIDYGFDVEIDGDLSVRKWSSRGLPSVYDKEVKLEAIKKIGDKTFKIVFEAEEPSWKHFRYKREFYINGQKVRRDKFFRELLMNDEELFTKFLNEIKREVVKKLKSYDNL